MIEKIVSGGQTGADQAALDAAIKLGISHGGWIPKGRITEEGTLPDKYHLQEMPSGSYEKRTEQNVLDSDGTVIISRGKLTGGSALTQKLAKKHIRPCLHIDLNKLPAFLASSHISTWVKENNIKILNVAGPRASKDPLIYRDTFYIIEGVIMLDSIDAHGSLIQDHPFDLYIEKLPVPPKTVDEAVDRLISEIPLKERVNIANMGVDDLMHLHNNLSVYVKSAFRLYHDNKELLESCKAISAHPIYSTDDVATVIIGVLYKKLIETHKMRLV